MHVLFLLPDIQEIPTGGNIYNRKIVDALSEYMEVTTHVFCQGNVLEESLFEGVDYIVVDSLLADAVAPALYPRTGDSPKWILLVHYLSACDPIKEDLIGDGLPASLQAYDGFITTSNFSKACLVRLGVPAHRVEVVYPGLDEGYRHKPFAKKDGGAGCRILTVSSLLPGKGLIEFVDVLERLPAGDWQWDVVGDDALDRVYAAEFKLKLKIASVSSRMNWLGAVPATEMPARYRAYDLFVLPSHFETLGMAIREAMASGLSVIAYDVGGISESLGQGGGCLIPPFEWRLMRDKMGACIADADECRQMGRDAQEASLSFSTWEDSAKQMAGFFGKTASTL